MIRIDEKKLTKLYTAGKLLDAKYGKKGTVMREAFHKKAIAWYYDKMLEKRGG